MATVETVAPPPVVEESLAARILRIVGKLPVQIFLVAVGLLWLVPTLGLFVTSILPASRLRPGRLVAGLLAAEPARPGQNYDQIFRQPRRSCTRCS